MNKRLFLFLFIINIQTSFAFQFSHIDWFDSSIGFAIAPRVNIRPNFILVNNSTFFYTNSKIVYEPIPIIFFRFANIFINKDGGGVAFAHFKNFKLRALLTYVGEGYRAAGFDERKNSLYIGGYFELYNFQFKYLKDIQHISNSSTLRIDLFSKYLNGNLSIEPHLAIQYWDKNYNNYYFGVKQSEANALAPFYDAQGDLNYIAELRLIYTKAKFKYICVASVKQLGQQIKNSPLVNRGDEIRVALGVLYKLF